MRQRWHDLLFAHWPFPVAEVARLVPAPLALDLFDGQAWVGVVPFAMSGVRLRGLPPVPPASSFLELNVRTYVHHRGVPGVWFFSLDAASRLAVRVARRCFHLPYFDARMRLAREGDTIGYSSLRVHRDAPWAALSCGWRVGRELPATVPGSLEFFLTERYCLYAHDGDRAFRGRIHHEPWRLREAHLLRWQSSMLGPLGLAPPAEPPHLCGAARIEVDIWGLEAL